MRLNQGLILILFLILSACRTAYAPTTVNFAQSDVKQSSIDSAFVVMLKPYKDSLDKSMNQVIGHLSQDLDKRMPEGTLGNMIADAMLVQAEKKFGLKPDVAVMNYGGIRLPSVKAGPITLGKIYELHPFDNRLVMMRLPGDALQKFLDLTASKGGWPIAGVSMTIQNKKAVNVIINGAPLQSNQNYWVALSDYVATGGDAADMLKQFVAEQKDYLIRNAIIDYLSALEKGGMMYQSGTQKRVQYAE
jgi:2',3'-cyclic-nucleotide 2'-phosphodiesterase (5'-nucleotidase family)